MGLHTRNTAALEPTNAKAKVMGDLKYGQEEDLIQAGHRAWRARSQTVLKSQAVLYLLKAAQKFNESGTAVKHGKKSWQADAAQHTVIKPDHTPTPVAVDLNHAKAVSENLGSWKESCKLTVGLAVFGALLYAWGAAPWILPGLYLVFVLLCFPQRVHSFCTQKWTFFLLDFCYCANILTVVYLLCFPDNTALENVVYALTDGPLAGALIVWQCAWVFGSADHAISVLIHLLPGLAMHAQRQYVVPKGWRDWLALPFQIWHSSSNTTTAGSRVIYGSPRGNRNHLTGFKEQAMLLLLGPMLFYLAWQIMYFVVVQVCFRRFILRNDYDTSYNCLARRAAKANNIWNRIVRRGSIAKRCVMYGLLQMVFTTICLLAFIPVYHFSSLASLWQVIKIGVSVYYGAVYQCQKVPKHNFMAGISKLQAEAVARGSAAAPVHVQQPVMRRSRKVSS